MNLKILDICRNGTYFKVNGNIDLFNHFWENTYKDWEESTFTIFDRFLTTTSSYLDVGAWIGPTVLYGAQKAKHVYAIEPDPIAYQELINNLQLNPAVTPKVTCVHSALTASSGPKRLYIRAISGDSSSSIIPTLSDENFVEVRGMTIEELTFEHNLKDINFIKMDIEAGEYFLLPAMRNYLKSKRPTLYLSLHPQFLKEEMNLKLNKDSYSESEHILFLTQRLLDSLDFYRYIYDAKGNIVDRSIILKETDFTSFLFTDKRW
jgi:FkbM family methyltransferase